MIGYLTNVVPAAGLKQPGLKPHGGQRDGDRGGPCGGQPGAAARCRRGLTATGLLALGLAGCGLPSSIEQFASRSQYDGAYECRDTSVSPPMAVITVSLESKGSQRLLHLPGGRVERLDAVGNAPHLYANKAYAWHDADVRTGLGMTPFSDGGLGKKFSGRHSSEHRAFKLTSTTSGSSAGNPGGGGAVLTDIGGVMTFACAHPGSLG